MKNKSVALFLTVMLLMCILPANVLAAPNKIYVSPTGDDNNSGSIEAPLKTLDGAREFVQNLKESNSGPIEVIFRGGEYRFLNGVNFTADDTGSEDSPITYKAYEGEKVVFKGSHAFDANKGKYVTDENVLKKVDASVRDFLVWYDLSEIGFKYEIPRTDKIQQYLFWAYPNDIEYLNLYLDDKEQMISQWPNGDDEYDAWVEAVEKGDSINGTVGGAFKYSGTRPERWKNAKSYWVGGYPAYNFRYERNSVAEIDTQKKTVRFATPTCMGIKSQESKYWKVFNLLEEIDMPGEWFIDKDSNKLYYYPPYAIKDRTLEISVLTEPFFNLTKVNYINIEGIEFAQSRTTAIHCTNVSYINIDNCTFRNIDGYGVKTKGDERTKYSYSRWQNAAKELHIRNCIFDNIGGSVALLESGNIDTLESGDSSFENNIIMRVSAKAKNTEALQLMGVGTTVKNNNFSSGSFHGITYRGCNHKIFNNEFYDMNKCSDDCGVIYNGRDYTARGTEIAYNYVHDNEAHRNISRGFSLAIYWDDSNPGQSAHHNIFVNNSCLLSSSSHDNYFQDNIIVNHPIWGMKVYDRGGYQQGLDQTALLANPQIYFNAFPHMQETLDIKYKGKLAFCKITGNFSVNSAKNDIQDLIYSEEHDNIEVSSCDDFVDPENQDYRIKSGSETAKKLPGLLNEKFDIDTIGVVGRNFEFNENTAAFKKLYPANGQSGISASNPEIAWERVFGANEYKLVVAKDKELREVVYEGTEAYNIVKIPELKTNTKYYWQVWAKNTSRQFPAEWKSVGDVYSFETAIYQDIDKLELQATLSEAEERLSMSNESDMPGDYKLGMLSALKKNVAKGKLYLSLPVGKVRQTEIDGIKTSIDTFWNDPNNINPGQVNLMGIVSKPSYWMPASSGYMNEEGELIVTANSSVIMYADKFKNLSENCIFKLKAKIDTGNWVAVCVTSKDVMPYATDNQGYFIAIKDQIIELQKNADTSSGSKILETYDTHIANDGNYHEIEFGAIRLNAGRLIIVKIDGKTIFEYVDAEAVNADLMPSFYSSSTSILRVASSDEKADADEYYSLIENNIPKEAVLVHDIFNNVASDFTIFQNSGKFALNQAGAVDISEGFINVDSLNYISSDKVKELFEDWDLSISTPIIVKDKQFYPVAATAKNNGYRVDYDDVTGMIFISKSGVRDNFTNMVKKLNTVKRFFDEMSKR